MGKNNILIKSFFKYKMLARQHIDSFNYFIDFELKNILEANKYVDSDIDPSFYIKYTDIRVVSPTVEENMLSYPIYPHDCRLRDFNYSGNVYVDIEYTINKEVAIKNNVFMGKIPIMLRSNKCYLSTKNIKSECELDTGGYFIIKGVEKVVMMQEQLSKNRIIIDVDSKNNLVSSVTSSTYNKKSKTTVTMKNNVLYVKHNSFVDEIPLWIVIKALGVVSDVEIISFIGDEPEILNFLSQTIEESVKQKIKGEKDALEYISKRLTMENGIEECKNILNDVLLPNITSNNLPNRKRAIYLGIMARRLIQAHLGIVEKDDRDFVGNKRYELAGQLLSLLFEDQFKKYNTDLKKAIDKVLTKSSRAQQFDALLYMNLQSNLITTAFSRAISTGNWNLKRFKMDRSGVSHVLSRLSYTSALGMITRICSQFEKDRKTSGPRALNTSSWGLLCPNDTPEGESCGLIKSLALMAEITTDECEERKLNTIENVLYDIGMINIETVNCNIYGKDIYLVFHNGSIVGITKNTDILVETLKNMRRTGEISKFISINKNDKNRSIFISSDGGRICRPLLIVKNEKLLIEDEDYKFIKNGYKSIEDLFCEGKIEFLDANESNSCLIAMNENEFTKYTTHMEIEPYTILGYIAGLIPFPHHNQSPRNTYQCAMGKQAMGFIGYNQNNRFDTQFNTLVYSHRPLVGTETTKLVNFDKLPAGQNAMIAVMSYSGYDIEDAVILNKASVERGFGRCSIYKSTNVTLKKYSTGFSDILASGDKSYRFECLDNDGIVKPGERIKQNQVLVNKQVPTENMGEYKPSREVFKGTEAYVDKVLLTRSGEDKILIKILMRETRLPEVGDKFSSRHGQKGVVGLIANSEDMPFTEDGIIPDLIMNPHGFPSRMTVGKILELLNGKAAISSGIADGTAFAENKTQTICDILTENGFNYSGKDLLMNGITGEVMKVYIFFGPVYYQKLKHMVADKIHARARGKRTMLTRQPTEGRCREGGLRLGEMEKDCLVGYGASDLLRERLLYSSDLFETFICEDCGILASKDCCSLCKKDSNINVKIPYAFKLLLQELMSMNIYPKLEIQ